MAEVHVDLDHGTDGTVHVGSIATTSGKPFFQYHPDFLDRGINPAPFSLEFDLQPQSPVDERGRLRSMFSDSAPDGWTRDIIDARVKQAGFDPRTLGPIDRLALVGPSGLGALSFRPAPDLQVVVPPLTIEDLAATVARIGEGRDTGIAVAEKVAGSLHGARPKANLWWNGADPSAIPVEGAHPWLIKFPKPSLDEDDAGLVEYAYANMVRAAGIEMSDTRLVPVRNKPGYFSTARFDRQDGRRFHFHSFAAAFDREMLGVSHYSELIQVTGLLQQTYEPDEQVIRRMIFNVLAVNRDDHVRNHGFLMRSDGTWAPSPAFDITFEPNAAHAMIVGTGAGKPTFADIAKSVEDARGDVASARRVAKEVRDVVLAWPAFAKAAGVSDQRTEQIRQAIFDNLPTDIGPRLSFGGFDPHRGMDTTS